MAGYGNRTAPDLEGLEEQHTNTRLGLTGSAPYSNAHEKHGSGATGGAGFGNKRSSHSDPSASTTDDPQFRFGLHKDTAPYSGASPLGSGSTGGAGFGNKTGSFSESHDSTVGKVLEKAGHVVHSGKLEKVGRDMRLKEGLGGEGA